MSSRVGDQRALALDLGECTNHQLSLDYVILAQLSLAKAQLKLSVAEHSIA